MKTYFQIKINGINKLTNEPIKIHSRLIYPTYKEAESSIESIKQVYSHIEDPSYSIIELYNFEEK